MVDESECLSVILVFEVNSQWGSYTDRRGNHGWDLQLDWKERRNVQSLNLPWSPHSTLSTLEKAQETMELKSRIIEEIGSTWLLEGNASFQAQINWFPAWETSWWTTQDRCRCWRSRRSLEGWKRVNTCSHSLLPQGKENIQSYIHLGKSCPVE